MLLPVPVFPWKNVSAYEHVMWNICLVMQFSAPEFSLFTLGSEDSCEIITNVTEKIKTKTFRTITFSVNSSVLDRTFPLFRVGSLIKSKKD